ncbi:hypothetical protein VCHA53O466_140186 [Vibrio chagasii]|nr:hypothetical protein VCHA53O466_140186 [Vibrio chagasii]
MQNLGNAQLMFLLRDWRNTHSVIKSLGQGCMFDLAAELKCHTEDDAWVINLQGALKSSGSVAESGITSVMATIIELDTMGLTRDCYTVLVLEDLDICIFVTGMGSNIKPTSQFELTRDQFWHYIESYPNYMRYKHDGVFQDNWESHVQASPEVIAKMHNGATDSRLYDWINRADSHLANGSSSYVTFDAEIENSVQTIGERLRCSAVWRASGLSKTDGAFIGVNVSGREYFEYTAFLVTALDLVLLFGDSSDGWTYLCDMSHDGFWSWFDSFPNLKGQSKDVVDHTVHKAGSDVVNGFDGLVEKIKGYSTVIGSELTEINEGYVDCPALVFDLEECIEGIDFTSDTFDVVLISLSYSMFANKDCYHAVVFKGIDLVVVLTDCECIDGFIELDVVSVMNREDFVKYLDSTPNHMASNCNQQVVSQRKGLEEAE